MKKFIFFLFIIATFANCSQDEVEVDPALKFMPIQVTSFNLDSQPILSPDGKNIIFRSVRYTHNPEIAAVYFELWEMNRYGEKLRRLVKREDLPEGYEIKFYQWSSNSDVIVHLSSSKTINSELWKVAFTGEKTVLHSFDYNMENLFFSPDGKKIAFTIWQPTPVDDYPVNKLYAANTDFSDTVLIEKGWFNKIDWAYNSKTILYSILDSENGNYDIWKTQLDGTGKTRLTQTPESEGYFQCSKTENLFTYSTNNNVFISPTDKFTPQLVLENASNPQLIPNRKLISLNAEQSSGEESWSESWIVDFNGNIIKKIAEGHANQVSFLESGDYFVYTIFGNIWIDYLP